MFYLYIYLDPRKPGKFCYENCASFFFEPIYVGKGKGDRAFSHLREVNQRRSTNNIKINKIKKILDSGLVPIVMILYYSSEEEILALEEQYIKTIGILADQTGPLTNIRKNTWEGNYAQIQETAKSRSGNRSLGKRFYTVTDGETTMRINASELQNYLEKGFTRIKWERPLKSNSMSRPQSSNPMFGKSAVKGRKWITTENNECLFLTEQEIQNIKVDFRYGRRVDKNTKKRIILEGSLHSEYMSDEEISTLPKGTRYQIGLVWRPSKKIFFVQ